jgi:hypothetical protein
MIEIRYFEDAEQVRKFWEENPDYDGVCECPSDPSAWNERTRKAFEGRVRRYASVEELFRELGLDQAEGQSPAPCE